MEKKTILNLALTAGLLISVAFISGCAPAETPEGEGTSMAPMLIFLVLLFALMYFVLIRPQRKRQKEHQQLVEELRRGDRVITAGGIYGVIETVSEDSVVIKVESDMMLRVAKNSVALKRER